MQLFFSRVYYSKFICGSTCFGRLPAHHQEHTTAQGASGSTFGRKRLERCWSWSVRSGNTLQLDKQISFVVQIIPPTRCNCFSRIYYSTFICGSTCFGRLSAHHQEHTTALGASGSTFGRKRLERCWSWSGRTTTNNAPAVSFRK